MPLVSVSFHQSCPSFDGIRSIDNTSRQVLLSKEYFLWSSLQRFDKSFVSRHFCWCVSDVNSFHREYRLNTPTFLWDYSHIAPLNQIEVTSETWPSIVYNLMISGASGVMQDLQYVVHLEISALKECELKRFSGAFRACAPSPLACLPCARSFSLSPTSSKRLLRRPWKTRLSDPKFEELAARPQTFQAFSSWKTNFWTANKSV